MIRPSSLPMLSQCARFESSGDDNDNTLAGTLRHQALSVALTCAGESPDLPDEDAQAVEWAADYVRIYAPFASHRMDCERKLSLTGDEFEPIIEGTPDVACGNHLFDLKWRYRDCEAQMAAYAAMMFENDCRLNVVHVHVLFGEQQRAVRIEFTREAAMKIVMDIVNSVTPDAPETPCDYCGWCSRRLVCGSYTRVVKTVALGYADPGRLAMVENWHPSQMETAEQISIGLTIWRKILQGWGASMERHAFVAAKDSGMTLPGYKIADESGGQYVSDVTAAFSALGIPQSEFLKACDVRMESSKKYKDKVGIVDLFKDQNGFTKKAPAKREVLKRLGRVMKDKKRKIYLKADKASVTDDSETNETEE